MSITKLPSRSPSPRSNQRLRGPAGRGFWVDKLHTEDEKTFVEKQMEIMQIKQEVEERQIKIDKEIEEN